ncbi:MlaD family protein [Candidatus Riflebacteria bacterium]
MVDTAELKVGIVTLTGVFLFALAVFSIKDLSLKHRNFGYITVTYKNVRGLSTGSLVYLQGVRVGKVIFIKHTDENQVKVRLQINGEFAREKIRKDSSYTILAVGAISNEKYIDISPPSTKNEPFLDLINNQGIVVKGSSNPGFSEVMASAQNLLHTVEGEGILAVLGDARIQASATKIISYLTNSGRDLSGITARFNKVLKKHEGSIQEFFNNTRELSDKLRGISNRIEKNLDSKIMQRILENSKRISENLVQLTGKNSKQKLDRILDKSHAIATQIEQLVADLTEEKKLSREIKDAVGAFRESAQNVREISKKVRGYLKNENLEKNLKDSLESARSMTRAVDEIYVNLKKTEVHMGYFLKFDTQDDSVQSDLFVKLDNQGEYLYYLGVENIGDEPAFDLIMEERNNNFSKRGGIISSKVGIGFMARSSQNLKWGFDIYDTVSPKLRFNTEFRLNDNLGLKFRADNITHDEKRSTETGILYQF